MDPAPRSFFFLSLLLSLLLENMLQAPEQGTHSQAESSAYHLETRAHLQAPIAHQDRVLGSPGRQLSLALPTAFSPSHPSGLTRNSSLYRLWAADPPVTPLCPREALLPLHREMKLRQEN